MKYIFTIIIVFSGTMLLFGQESLVKYNNAQIYLKVKPEYSNKLSNSSKNLILEDEMPILNNFLKANNIQLISSEKPFVNNLDTELSRIFKLTVLDSTQVNTIIENLKASGNYEYVERVPLRKIISIPNDTHYNLKQWSLKKIKASEAWDINSGGADVVVAVVDNAIQTTHVDLSANMVAGIDMSELNDTDPNPPNDSFSHGSHVSGIVAAVTNNNLGIASAGRNKVKVMPIKATPDTGDPNGIYFGFEGIVWAADNGARVISLSWGGGGFSNAEQDVVNYASNKGSIIVAAAGNENSNELQYPASYENVISVASLDSTDIRSSFSSYGSKVDISAPGRGILSTIPTNAYASYSGTSMATPLVSACIGYLLSSFPSLSNSEVESLLKNTADDISSYNPSLLTSLGAGRINLLSAVACKTENIDVLTVETGLNRYLCNGDSTLISVSPISGATYSWFKNGIAITQSQASFYTKETGVYTLEISKGACTRKIKSRAVEANLIKSTAPQVSSIESIYCKGFSDTLKIPSISCAGDPFYESVYTGGVVGYDGNMQSGDSPVVHFSAVPGLIDSLEVSITWHKKDGGAANSCGSADGGGIPFNEELGFGLVSPSGITIELIKTGTYARGTASSGLVTTVFKQSGAVLLQGSLPFSGSFKPSTSFDGLVGELPNGAWTLLASDDAQIDPLCVSGFSLKVYTNAASAVSNLSWWDASSGGNKLSNNSNLVLNSNNVGSFEYYAQNQCSGACATERVKATYTVKTIPEIVGFAFNKINITMAQAQEIYNANSYMIIKSSTNIYTVSGINNQNQPFSYQISNFGPSQSPVSICDNADYVLLATGCNGSVTWSNGMTNMGIIIQNLSNNANYTATCNQSFACGAPPTPNFNFSIANTDLLLTEKILPNVSQQFYGMKLGSSQKIQPASNIKYRAIQNIILSPGFSAASGNVFSAEIGPCEND